MALFSLIERDTVRVSGPDAHKLLSDTLTCRFDDAMLGLGRWFALLSPQGKIQIDGLVTFANDAYWFDVAAPVAQAFVKKMKLYRLRASVAIEHQTHAIFWSPNDDAPIQAEVVYKDGRSPKLGTRYLVPWEKEDDALRATPPPVDAYDRARIAAAVPESEYDFGPDEVFPHDVAMDILGGVDFKKGCYIGQEVVSRMEHRGTARRRPVIVSGIEAPAGSAVVASGREAGAIGQVVGGKAVAIVRLDRFDGGEVTVGSKPVVVALPEWATYRLGESAEGA